MQRVLIANRGEIAVRIARTCRALGIVPLGVCSESDRDAPHVRACEAAVVLGPGGAASYLDVEGLLDAARRLDAQAVHPGYGFLAERADFARAVREAGLAWIGPPPEVMELAGSKALARRAAREAGLPVLDGGEVDADDPAAAREVAGRLGYPVLVKAVHGGGGRGMRRVASAAELGAALRGAAREARAAFGRGDLLLEPWVSPARHVEVQVFGDVHGRVVELGERDCSLQRRHQKVVEESPAPGLDAGLRRSIREAAVRLATALGYVGAGTVEFLLGPDGRFWFLEINARLQVEHPVTESVREVDLVAWQLRVADGQHLPDPPAARGHAIEARLVAEDPGAGWRPSTGRLAAFRFPRVPGVRVDAGVEAGSEVSPHYDALLAKVVAWGEGREQARARLLEALEGATVLGVRTNRTHLQEVLVHPDFVRGAVHTGLLDAVPVPEPPAEVRRLARLVAALDHLEGLRRGPPHLPVGWRGRPQGPPALHLDGTAVRFVDLGGAGWVLTPEDEGAAHRVRRALGGRVEVDGLVRPVAHVRLPDPGAPVAPEPAARRGGEGERSLVRVGRWDVEIRWDDPLPAAGGAREAGSLRAPMPGRVLEVRTAPGRRVAAGEALLVLEAMKTEHVLRAPFDGTVRAVRVAAGQVVDGGPAVLVEVEPLEAGD